MPRSMSGLPKAFAADATQALDFARGVEIARSALSYEDKRHCLPISRVEYAYELAYLQAFTAWERFLEDSLLRYLCGHAARHGRETPSSGTYHTNLAAAKTALYGGQQFLLWHNPSKVIQRASNVLIGSRHAAVIASIQTRIAHFAAVRHRIAHAHGKAEFDAATMALAGKRYSGARPGRFLRDWAPHPASPTRWIDAIVTEFRGLAFQIVPV